MSVRVISAMISIFSSGVSFGLIIAFFIYNHNFKKALRNRLNR